MSKAQQTIIRRESPNEVTFAVVTWKGVEGREALRKAVGAAVKEWIETTDEGKMEFSNSDENLNIGDLANLHYGMRPLSSILAKHGVVEFDVDVYSEDMSPGYWAFDDVLGV